MTDQKLYDRPLDELYGQPAEESVLKFLEDWGDVDRAEHFPYGEKDVDIKVWMDLERWFYIDVERRKNWVWPQMNFPFSIIHIPYRKRGMILNRQPFKVTLAYFRMSLAAWRRTAPVARRGALLSCPRFRLLSPTKVSLVTCGLRWCRSVFSFCWTPITSD